MGEEQKGSFVSTKAPKRMIRQHIQQIQLDLLQDGGAICPIGSLNQKCLYGHGSSSKANRTVSTVPMGFGHFVLMLTHVFA